MVFSELFFLFFFFILCMALVYTRKTVRGQNAVLLVFSLIFYAWSGPVLLILLCAMTFICWLAGRMLGSVRVPFYRRMILFMTVAACVLIFGFFKYSGFLASTLQSVFRFDAVLPKIILPIGISFYTFQLLSYAVDVYRGETEPQRNYLTLLLYAALFHQCVAGPIVRYSDVCAELQDRRVRLSDISAGITRFSLGLAKKAILANYCGSLATAALSAESLAGASSGTVFLGTVFYMLQIYLDFSAYSDMAIGMGLMCGLHYCENFNYPYCAESVTDFWRRWHISLSTFFRDYVYIPLGGNRHGIRRQMRNLFIVWLLTGLWHGASWNYVLWGLYYFLLLAGEKLLLPHTPYRELPLWRRILRRCGVLAAVWFGWMLFYFEDLSMLGSAIADLFFRNGFWDLNARLMLLNNLFFLAVAIAACTPVLAFLMKKAREAATLTPAWQGLVGAVSVASPVLLLFFSFLSLVGNTYNPFLYFQF